MIALGSSASAQTNLQNSASNLQQQASQTQNTRNLQEQTGQLQTNSPGQALSKNQPKSLGVVSDPKQTTPEAVAIADPNLKTDLTKTDENSSVKGFVAILLIFFATAITYWVYKNYYQLPAREVVGDIAEVAPKLKRKKKSTAPKTKGGKKHKSKRRH